MNTLPVAHYLRDLAAEHSPRATRDSKAQDVEARIEAAHARGVLEGRAAAQAEYDEVLRQQLAQREQAFVRERESWASAQGGVLAELFASRLGDIEMRIGEKVGVALKPMLGSEVAQRAVEELKTRLGQMLEKGEYAKISVFGPEDLLKSLRDHLEGRGQALTFIETTTCDLRVEADETILETRIGEWIAALEGEPA